MKTIEVENPQEIEHMELVEKIVAKRGLLEDIDPQSHEAKQLRGEIVQMEYQLKQLETKLGYNLDRAA